MASPMYMGNGGPNAGNWMPAQPSQQQHPGAYPGTPSEAEESGVQVRPMSLKVLYTFDKDSRVNCLARYPQTLQVQTVALDDRSWIGLVDLRLCVQAVAQCSPELVNHNDHDFTIYAFDYSEPDTPLVGQGMLSWALHGTPPPEDGIKYITGRVCKNTLALFGNGVRETLEVKLRLTEVTRIAVNSHAGGEYFQSQPKNAPTPAESSEWNAFIQSNPAIGRPASMSAPTQSPSLAPAVPDMPYYPPPQSSGPPSLNTMSSSLDTGAGRSLSKAPPSRPASRPASRQSSISYAQGWHGQPLLAPRPPAVSDTGATGSPPPAFVGNDEVASTSSASAATAAATAAAAATPPPENPMSSRPSRPSSQASRRRSRNTGRPRGRPRKVDGNTSAAEEQPTDADIDDGSKPKRAKITKADYPINSTLDMPAESLRVAASTSGSLRTLRPAMAATAPGVDSNGVTPGSHLLELPRAPTPVPRGGAPLPHARKLIAERSRRDSMASAERNPFADRIDGPQSRDACSPVDSVAPSPENYTPEASVADMGSSPPVPRSTNYIPQSSPMPSSPILPPMPRPQPDSGFMSGGMDDIFDDDDCGTDLRPPPPPTPQERPAPVPEAVPMSHMQNMQHLPALDAAAPASSPAPVQATTSESGQTAESATALTAVSATATTTATVPPTSPPAAPIAAPAAASPVTHTALRQAKQTSQPPSRRNSVRTTEQYSFKAINPGPPEFLPTTSIYNPPYPRNKSAAAVKRSNSEPVDHQQQRQQEQPQENMPGSSAMEIDQQAPVPGPTGSQTTAGSDELSQLTKLLSAEPADDMFAMDLEDKFDAMQSVGEQPPLPQQATVGNGAAPSTKPMVAASDPLALPPLTLPALPPPPTAFSEVPCPPSDSEASGRLNKNLVRKAIIRERLEQAISSGEMPQYCQNCGAIETPTWRKMWTQDHEGEPGFYSYSEKPGQVTAIDILERDSDGKPTRYRLVKKALGPAESSRMWKLMILCNPCGIWLSKFKSHRPSDRWDKDAARLGQPRRKRESKSKASRSKKMQARSDSQPQPTSEAYFTTDPAGPADLDEVALVGVNMVNAPPSRSDNAFAHSGACNGLMPLPPASTETSAAAPMFADAMHQEQPESNHNQPVFLAGSNRAPASSVGSAKHRTPGSRHSRGSGTANSPISIDDHFGTTRRILFPSPRKDGVPKVLGELAVNIVMPCASESAAGKKELAPGHTIVEGSSIARHQNERDDMVDLFGTPPQSTRPSTPPPRSEGHGGSSGSGSHAPFKTPTRPTPTHRPITRSISKSIRSVSYVPKSPSETFTAFQRTPSRTPGGAALGSASKRRSTLSITPGRQSLHTPFQLDGVSFDMPFTSTLNQLLSEANEFMTGSPSQTLPDMGLANLSAFEDHNDLTSTFHESTDGIDLSSYLDTDLVMPSSSPLLRRKTGHGHTSRHATRQSHVSFGEELSFESSDMWTDFSDTVQA